MDKTENNKIYIYLITVSDLDITTSSFEIIDITNTFDKAIEELQSNTALIEAYKSDVINEERHLVILEEKINSIIYNNIIFSTENKKDKRLINI